MIEDLIYQAISESEKIAAKLATHNKNPAVFYQAAPHDQDVLWNGKQYPRLDYTIDWQYNPERNTVGTMMLNLWCTNECEAPEDIGAVVSSSLSSLFVTDKSDTYCLLWNRTDSFDTAGNEPQMCGVTILFDVIAFPCAVAGTPDPVLSICRYTKKLFPNALVIGIDRMSPILRPDDAKPVIYYRQNGISNNVRNTWQVAFMNISIIGHFIAPSINTRLSMLKKITEKLAIDGEVITDDGSPMRLIAPLSYTIGNSPITSGQLTVTAEYGVLRDHIPCEVQNNINFNR